MANNSIKFNSKLKFLEKSYDETLQLINLSQSYFARNADKEKLFLAFDNRQVYSSAMKDIIFQLKSLLRWFSTHMSSSEEEILTAKNRLIKIDAKTIENERIHAALSKPVLYLLTKTTKLYKRVERMEDKIFSKAS